MSIQSTIEKIKGVEYLLKDTPLKELVKKINESSLEKLKAELEVENNFKKGEKEVQETFSELCQQYGEAFKLLFGKDSVIIKDNEFTLKAFIDSQEDIKEYLLRIVNEKDESFILQVFESFSDLFAIKIPIAVQEEKSKKEYIQEGFERLFEYLYKPEEYVIFAERKKNEALVLSHLNLVAKIVSFNKKSLFEEFKTLRYDYDYEAFDFEIIFEINETKSFALKIEFDFDSKEVIFSNSETKFSKNILMHNEADFNPSGLEKDILAIITNFTEKISL